HPQVLHGQQAARSQSFGGPRANPRQRGERLAPGIGVVQSSTITASTSNATPLGRPATSMVERAGYGASKYSDITELTTATSPRSVRYRPSRTMSSIDPPASSATAL